MNKFTKLGAAFLSLLIGGCAGTKVVGSIDCGDSKIDVVSIKNERNSLNGQTWSKGVSYKGVTTQIHELPYAGHFPDSYKRQITGTKPFPEFGMHDFQNGQAFQFFMGDFPTRERAALTQCLVENDKTLRSLLLKTKAMQQFPPRGEFNHRFIFWDVKESDLKLRFDTGGTEEEYLTLSLSKGIYYHNKSKKQLMKVGEVVWGKDGKLSNVAIDIRKRRKGEPTQKDPTTFKREGKTLAEYFSVPFVVWTPKY